MTFTKFICWKTERIGRVIAKAALDVDRATFLATHMPMRKISYEITPLHIRSTNEDDFLDELNRMDAEDLHVFAVIKGITGTGKSHFIRWLYEMYKQCHPNDNVVIGMTLFVHFVQPTDKMGFTSTGNPFYYCKYM